MSSKVSTIIFVVSFLICNHVGRTDANYQNMRSFHGIAKYLAVVRISMLVKVGYYYYIWNFVRFFVFKAFTTNLIIHWKLQRIMNYSITVEIVFMPPGFLPLYLPIAMHKCLLSMYFPLFLFAFGSFGPFSHAFRGKIPDFDCTQYFNDYTGILSK